MNGEFIEPTISECSAEWTTQGGVYGYKVTSKKNDKSIFLPAAGCRDDISLLGAGSYGYYCSRSLLEGGSYYAYILNFNYFYRDYNDRCYGQSVRPVLSE